MSGVPEMIIPPHGIPDDVVRIVVPSSDSPLSRHITVEKAARVRFLLDYAGTADFLLHLNIHSGAFVDVFHVAGSANGKIKSSSVYGLGEHASLNVWTFATGGSGLIAHDVQFQKPHGFADLHGLSLLSGVSGVTHRVRAFHNAPNCVSRQFYKSIVSDQARSEFESLVEVVRTAQKTDSRQLNKNLLLSRGAKALSRPELRIDADDVACAHGSATGELNPDEVFYARTRGLSLEQAQRMMIGAFAGEILEALPQIPLKGILCGQMAERILELASV